MMEIVKVGKHKYKLSEDEIKDGDLIYNSNANKIDKCLMIVNHGMMCVEFESGNRAVFSTRTYKKAIKQ